MRRPTLEENFITAWRTIAPGAELPTIEVKKWPRGRVHQITMPGVHTLSLWNDEFLKCLLALETVAGIINKHRPRLIGPGGYPVEPAAAADRVGLHP